MSEIHYADKEHPAANVIVLAHWNMDVLHETDRWHISKVFDGFWHIDIDNEWYGVTQAPSFWWHLPEVPEAQA